MLFETNVYDDMSYDEALDCYLQATDANIEKLELCKKLYSVNNIVLIAIIILSILVSVFVGINGLSIFICTMAGTSAFATLCRSWDTKGTLSRVIKDETLKKSPYDIKDENYIKSELKKFQLSMGLMCINRRGEKYFLPFQRKILLKDYSGNSTDEIFAELNITRDNAIKEICKWWMVDILNSIPQFFNLLGFCILLLAGVGVFALVAVLLNFRPIAFLGFVPMTISIYTLESLIPDLGINLVNLKYINRKYLNKKDDEYICTMLIHERLVNNIPMK